MGAQLDFQTLQGLLRGSQQHTALGDATTEGSNRTQHRVTVFLKRGYVSADVDE